MNNEAFCKILTYIRNHIEHIDTCVEEREYGKVYYEINKLRGYICGVETAIRFSAEVEDDGQDKRGKNL